MKTHLRKLLAGVVVCLAALPLAGCETNPATGRQIFTLGSDIQDDRHIGAQAHPELTKEFGGVYDDPNVTSYVALLASKLTAASEFPNIEWRFTVLNSSDLNAFAVPGGYVYVTRGLMALAENEAELAGVLAHEIGHVTARHSAERQGRATAIGLLGALLGVAGAGQLANVGTQLASAQFVQHYSQTQELEADSLGVRYLSRTGYDVRAMASFLAKMREHTRLQNKILGRPENAVDEGHFLASHPRTVDRVEEATEEAAKVTGSGTALNRDSYLQHIDGLVFGDDADQGFIRGREFIHPKVGFRFEAPEGFRMINNPDSVVGIGPGKARFKFDMGPPYAGSAADYLQRVWGAKTQIAGLERFTVDGMDAATARVPVRIENRPGEGRLVAIKASGDRFYQFIFAGEPEDTRRFSDAFRRMTYSVRRLSPQEAAQIKPWRIRIHQVRPGESVASLSAGMALGEFKEDWFRVLNGLGPGDQVRPGQMVKLVGEAG